MREWNQAGVAEHGIVEQKDRPARRPSWPAGSPLHPVFSARQPGLYAFEIADGALHAWKRVLGVDLVLEIDAALVFHLLELLENRHHRHDPFADGALAILFCGALEVLD